MFAGGILRSSHCDQFSIHCLAVLVLLSMLYSRLAKSLLFCAVLPHRLTIFTVLVLLHSFELLLPDCVALSWCCFSFLSFLVLMLLPLFKITSQIISHSLSIHSCLHYFAIYFDLLHFGKWARFRLVD